MPPAVLWTCTVSESGPKGNYLSVHRNYCICSKYRKSKAKNARNQTVCFTVGSFHAIPGVSRCCSVPYATQQYSRSMHPQYAFHFMQSQVSLGAAVYRMRPSNTAATCILSMHFIYVILAVSRCRCVPHATQQYSAACILSVHVISCNPRCLQVLQCAVCMRPNNTAAVCIQ